MVDTTRLRGSIFCQSPSSISGLSLPSYRSAFGYYVFLHMKIEIYYGAPNQQYLNFLRLRKFSQLNKYVCVATQTIITKKEKKNRSNWVYPAPFVHVQQQFSTQQKLLYLFILLNGRRLLRAAIIPNGSWLFTCRTTLPMHIHAGRRSESYDDPRKNHQNAPSLLLKFSIHQTANFEYIYSIRNGAGCISY